MLEQTQLFDFPPMSRAEKKSLKLSASAQRKKDIDRAMRNAGKAFCDAYRKFVLEYADSHEEFGTEHITADYKKTGLPRPVTGDYRSTGGIVQGLITKGLLISVRFEKSKGRRGAPIEIFKKG